MYGILPYKSRRKNHAPQRPVRGNVERIAAAVIENLARTICVGEKLLSVRPSIGIAIYPDGGVNGEALIQNADAAMYRAKKVDCGYAVHEPHGAGQAECSVAK